ncbi:MAG: hypothetical protein ACI8XB_002144 [Patiriisocius sp.]
MKTQNYFTLAELNNIDYRGLFSIRNSPIRNS